MYQKKKKTLSLNYKQAQNTPALLLWNIYAFLPSSHSTRWMKLKYALLQPPTIYYNVNNSKHGHNLSAVNKQSLEINEQ